MTDAVKRLVEAIKHRQSVEAGGCGYDTRRAEDAALPDLEAMLNELTALKQVSEQLAEKSKTLQDCARSSVGARGDDPDAHEALDMYFEASFDLNRALAAYEAMKEGSNVE